MNTQHPYFPKVGDRVRINPEWKKWYYNNRSAFAPYGDGSEGEDFTGGEVLTIKYLGERNGCCFASWDDGRGYLLDKNGIDVFFGSGLPVFIRAEEERMTPDLNKCSCGGPAKSVFIGLVSGYPIDVCSVCRKEK